MDHFNKNDAVSQQKTAAVWVLVFLGIFITWCVWEQRAVQKEIRDTQALEIIRRDNAIESAKQDEIIRQRYRMKMNR